MKEELDERVKEEEEERDAWMADPFPDEREMFSNVHPSIDVLDDEEDDDVMDRMDTSTLTGVRDEEEVIERE